jgi:hypothetical protein
MKKSSSKKSFKNDSKLGLFAFALSDCSTHTDKRCLRKCSEALWVFNQNLLLADRVGNSIDETDAFFKSLIRAKLNEHTFKRTSDHVNLQFTVAFQNPDDEEDKKHFLLCESCFVHYHNHKSRFILNK